MSATVTTVCKTSEQQLQTLGSYLVVSVAVAIVCWCAGLSEREARVVAITKKIIRARSASCCHHQKKNYK